MQNKYNYMDKKPKLLRIDKDVEAYITKVGEEKQRSFNFMVNDILLDYKNKREKSKVKNNR